MQENGSRKRRERPGHGRSHSGIEIDINFIVLYSLLNKSQKIIENTLIVQIF